MTRLDWIIVVLTLAGAAIGYYRGFVVGALYGLRSTIVHGGNLTERKLENTLRKISTVPDQGSTVRFGDRLGHALDRIRDLVRRAILVRLCLATGDAAPWPLNAGEPIDGQLADDEIRQRWREHWRRRLAALGVPSAAEKAAPAAEFLSRDQR